MTWPANQETRDLINELLDRMNMCGCGSGKSFEIIRDMLDRAQQRLNEDFSVSFYDPMGEICGVAVEFIAHVMDGWGLMSHGSSVGGAWITDKGQIILRFLNEFGTRPKEWPDWVDGW